MPPAASRPSIAINASAAPGLTAALLDMTIVDDGQAPAACTARFSNWGPIGRRDGFLFFDLRQFDFGAAMEVTLGDAVVFNGRIDAIDADFNSGTPPTISLRGQDRLSDLQRTQRSRTFERITDADLVRRIANEHGMAAVVDLTGPVHAAMSQLNQTDLEFLRGRLRRTDAVLWAEGGVIHASHAAGRNHGTISLAWGSDLAAFSASADLVGQRTRVVVSGWDVASKSPIRSVADDRVLALEVGDGRSGASVLSSTLGPHEQLLAHLGPTSATSAQAMAAARYKAASRRFVVVRGESTGSPTMRVGSRVAVSGVGELFGGTYYVSEVRHRFNLDAGFRTAFTAYSARLAAAR
jgi:phage protein D